MYLNKSCNCWFLVPFVNDSPFDSLSLVSLFAKLVSLDEMISRSLLTVNVHDSLYLLFFLRTLERVLYALLLDCVHSPSLYSKNILFFYAINLLGSLPNGYRHTWSPLSNKTRYMLLISLLRLLHILWYLSQWALDCGHQLSMEGKTYYPFLSIWRPSGVTTPIGPICFLVTFGQ